MKGNNSKTPSVKPNTKTDREFDISKININIKFKNERQKQFIKLIEEKDMVICAGSAGTGKSYLAIHGALKLLKTAKDSNGNPLYDKIIMVRSIQTIDSKTESLGSLPGNMDDKMSIFTLPFMCNITKIIGNDNTKKMIDAGIIEFLPIGYIRGISIDRAIVICEESQNVPLESMRTLMTRIEASKLIIVGDESQKDIDRHKVSSLSIVYEMFNNYDNIGTMRFERCDIVRSKLVMLVEDRFDKLMEERKELFK